MKYIYASVFLWLASTPIIFSQNALLDGINNNKTERNVSGDIYSKFKAAEKGDCSFEFQMEKYENYELDYSIFVQTYTWLWNEITTMTLGEQSIELSGSTNPINLSSVEQSTKKTSTGKIRKVNLYFASTDATKVAATWIADKVKTCGGNLSQY